MQGVGTVMGLAKGGLIEKPKNMAVGGYTSPIAPAVPVPVPSSSFGQFLSSAGSLNPIQETPSMKVGSEGSKELQQGIAGGIAAVAKKLKGSPQAADQLTGTQSIGAPDTGTFNPDSGPNQSMGVPDTGGFKAMAGGGLANKGGHVKPKNPAQKAVKKGDSYDNDKIPAKLSAGENVLPRSVTMGQDPVKASADFVAKVLAKRGKR